MEQVVSALEFRLKNLEETMDHVEKVMTEKEELKSVYWSSYERHEEISSLLNFIKDKQGCGSGGCTPCKTPCGASA